MLTTIISKKAQKKRNLYRFKKPIYLATEDRNVMVTDRLTSPPNMAALIKEKSLNLNLDYLNKLCLFFSDIFRL